MQRTGGVAKLRVDKGAVRYQVARALSEDFLKQDLPHYSLRYTNVMGVRADFVKWEREQHAKNEVAIGADYRLDD